jgi:hypothetical protein
MHLLIHILLLLAVRTSLKTICIVVKEHLKHLNDILLASSNKLPWLAETGVITLKLQMHAVNAS